MEERGKKEGTRGSEQKREMLDEVDEHRDKKHKA